MAHFCDWCIFVKLAIYLPPSAFHSTATSIKNPSAIVLLCILCLQDLHGLHLVLEFFSGPTLTQLECRESIWMYGNTCSSCVLVYRTEWIDVGLSYLALLSLTVLIGIDCIYIIVGVYTFNSPTNSFQFWWEFYGLQKPCWHMLGPTLFCFYHLSYDLSLSLPSCIHIHTFQFFSVTEPFLWFYFIFSALTFGPQLLALTLLSFWLSDLAFSDTNNNCRRVNLVRSRPRIRALYSRS